jgi:hypothetical protein
VLLLLLLLLAGMSLAERAQRTPAKASLAARAAPPAKGVVRRKAPLGEAKARIESEVWNARRYWAERGVAGARDAPLNLEFDESPQTAAGQGGFGRVKMSTYWLQPNPWGMDPDTERALVHHEVRHALPGGEVGGVDGQGHSEGGLMGVPFGVPRELTTRSLRRKAALRIQAMRKPSGQ